MQYRVATAVQLTQCILIKCDEDDFGVSVIFITSQGSKTLQSSKQCSAVQCSAVQCSAVQCRQRSLMQCSAVQTAQCNVMQCSADSAV